jgi:hypothetical protein
MAAGCGALNFTTYVILSSATRDTLTPNKSIDIEIFSMVYHGKNKQINIYAAHASSVRGRAPRSVVIPWSDDMSR